MTLAMNMGSGDAKVLFEIVILEESSCQHC